MITIVEISFEVCQHEWRLLVVDRRTGVRSRLGCARGDYDTDKLQY